MPTILRWKGYRFYFYSDESNEPPHVHVARGSRPGRPTAKFWLRPVQLAKNSGFDIRELNYIAAVTTENQQALLEVWNGYFKSKR